MSMDNQYIKMILALPDEFFENWEWRTGDKAVNILNSRIITILWATEPDIWKTERYAMYYSRQTPFSKEGSTKIKLCEIRPLPSQEQLQEMIKKHNILHNVKLTDLEILERVVGWHVRRDHNKNQNKCSKQIFLEVLMWLNDKLWDGEKWV